MNARFLAGVAPAIISISFLPAQTNEPAYARAYGAGEYGTAFPEGVTDFDEKGLYHQRRLRGMKREFNDYSHRLYDLRRRFDKIFYGRDLNGSTAAPFVIGDEPAPPGFRPSRKVEYEPPPPPPPPAPPEPIVAEATPYPVEDADILAFNVEAPGQFKDNGPGFTQVPTVEKPARKFDYFLFPRAGYSHPGKKRQGVTGGTTFKREYKVGRSYALSGGIRSGPWSLGLDLSHRTNELKRRSHYGPLIAMQGENVSTAVLLQGSYAVPVYSKLSLVLRGGVGASRSDRTALFSSGAQADVSNWGLAGTAGGSLSWAFTDSFAAHLGAHYYYEEELPTYNADFGFAFDF